MDVACWVMAQQSVSETNGQVHEHKYKICKRNFCYYCMYACVCDPTRLKVWPEQKGERKHVISCVRLFGWKTAKSGIPHCWPKQLKVAIPFATAFCSLWSCDAKVAKGNLIDTCARTEQLNV